MAEINLAHVAKLARLRLSEEEEKSYQGIFDRILKHFKDLESVDTNNVDPLYHFSEQLLLRKDEAQKLLDATDLKKNAPSLVGNSISLPKFVSE